MGSMVVRVCGIGDEGADSLVGQVRLHERLGLRGIELRAVDGRRVHELDAAGLDRVVAAVGGAGLVVPVLDTPLGDWSTTIGRDLADDERVLRASAGAAARLGCTRLRIMSYPNDGRPEPDWRRAVVERVRALARIAEDLGVTLLHENCVGWAGAGAERTLALLDEVGSPALRLLFDTGNGLAHGYPALPFLREVIPYVDHVHVKDGRRVGGTAVFGTPGSGEVRLGECVGLLLDAGYRGWFSLEPHVALIPHLDVADDPERRARAYADCVHAFRTLVGAVPAVTG
ncbi:sugar phosphate isomerase/epimerase family protein [Actinokineospora spheciospongiae]|nr:sugar phosphate isomerase/epimerase family protein [Actinokineospora spheciospongiae]